jgi:hypothetical protein
VAVAVEEVLRQTSAFQDAEGNSEEQAARAAVVEFAQ